MKPILYGTIVVGTLDAIDAIVVFGLRGSTPIRVFQGIASGWLGRASFAGGLPTALLGVLTHFFIAFAIVATYYAASRKISRLRRQPLIYGAIYGVAVYFFMNLVVIPLSAIGAVRFSWPLFVNGILIHVFGIGIPSALFAARGENL
jgi:uncharacterized membrane protein YagU involved in acid resistance